MAFFEEIALLVKSGQIDKNVAPTCSDITRSAHVKDLTSQKESISPGNIGCYSLTSQTKH